MRALSITLWPEQRRDPVATDSAVASRRDKGENRQTRALARRTSSRLAITFESQSAERPKEEHGASPPTRPMISADPKGSLAGRLT